MVLGEFLEEITMAEMNLISVSNLPNNISAQYLRSS